MRQAASEAKMLASASTSASALATEKHMGGLMRSVFCPGPSTPISMRYLSAHHQIQHAPTHEFFVLRVSRLCACCAWNVRTRAFTCMCMLWGTKRKFILSAQCVQQSLGDVGGGRARVAVKHQLHAHKQARAPHVPNQRHRLLQLLRMRVC